MTNPLFRRIMARVARSAFPMRWPLGQAMASRDQTQIGGSNTRFNVTEWTQIAAIREADADGRREAQGKVLGQYWKPVYCFLRRRGYGNERAKDLTQGFFTDIILGRNLAARADHAKGKFRTFLLTALDCYLADEQRKARAAKRRPASRLVSLESSGSLPEPAENRTPDQAFHHQWALNLVEEVLAETEAYCRGHGQEVHWRVFEARVLQPILEVSEPPALTALAEELGIASPKAAANMIVTVKRRFMAAMKGRIRQWAGSEEEVAGEIEDLLQILSAGGAARVPQSRTKG